VLFILLKGNEKGIRNMVKQSLPSINITKIQIGEYEVSVPQGFSELLNSAGAWGKKRDYPTYLEEYDRFVEMREGRVFTVLKKRK
jgi:hypothetical protein